MTIEEAIESLNGCIVSEEYENGKANGNVTCDLTREILDMAIAALREKQERDNEHIGETTDIMPLTLEQLREMGKTDWVWLTFPELPSEESGWYRAKQVYATYSHKHYGETWIAYCSRPKEAANG